MSNPYYRLLKKQARMKRRIIGALLIWVMTCVQLSAQSYYQKPKLIVNIVVDQMRQDYLYRFWDLYGNEGFKKLVNGGYNFANTHYSYYPTYTAAGHANVSTGATPSVHGIVGNDWYENATGEKMYCTRDWSVKGVGTETSSGQMSPKNLKTSTFGDELRLANNYRTRVFGISMKDRGAILCAGHLADAAYWFQGDESNFITSTYYMKDLPGWVKDFNNRKLTDKYLNQTWNPILSTRTLEKYTDVDDNPFEGKFAGKSSPTFPYNLKDLRKDNGNELILTTPFGNTLAFDFAEALIKNEKLGKSGSGVPDVLYLSLSSTDYIGHFFGIRSMEVADTYLRLDRDLASFIKLLENQVGRGEFMIVLTADHAAADNPAYMTSKRFATGLFRNNLIKVDLRQHLEQKFGHDLIEGYKNLQIYLNKSLIAEQGINEDEVKKEIYNFMRFKPGVQKVFNADILAQGNQTDDIMKLYMRGYSADRCGDVYIMLLPGWIGMDWQEIGTTHGSPYTYDTHVPLLFYGKNIPKGFTYDKTSVSQLAATLSSLMGIVPPNGCTVEPLIDYFTK